MAEHKDNWLYDILRETKEELDKWPKWKLDAMRAERDRPARYHRGSMRDPTP